jgi:RNA polymerase sigma-70 factor (ECF subfamily)
LARVADGEVAAIRTLLDQYAARALSVATRVLGDRRDAEDVVQETFLELWQRAGQFDAHRGSALAWVLTIARSRAIDRLRASVRAARALDAASADLLPPVEPTPDELEDLRRDYLRVHAALSKLPPAQYDVIHHAFWGGLSKPEIARATAAPLGTVKLRLQTAMRKLARSLNGRAAPAAGRLHPAF